MHKTPTPCPLRNIEGMTHTLHGDTTVFLPICSQRDYGGGVDEQLTVFGVRRPLLWLAKVGAERA